MQVKNGNLSHIKGYQDNKPDVTMTINRAALADFMLQKPACKSCNKLAAWKSPAMPIACINWGLIWITLIFGSTSLRQTITARTATV